MYRLLWAKKESVNASKEHLFHPLLFHMIDVASVTEYFWRSVLEQQLIHKISSKLGLAAEPAGKWIAFWAGLHDLGKASPAFQGKWYEGWTRLNEELRQRSLPTDPLPHGILSAAFIPQLLIARFPDFPEQLAVKLGRTLGGHHGSFPRSGDLMNISKDQRGGEKWGEVRRELFEKFSDQYCFEDAGIPENEPGQSFYLMMAGLVSVADWIGSNEDYFPYTSYDLNITEYVAKSRQRAQKALASLGWLGWRAPQKFMSMAGLFPAIRGQGLRPLQQATVQLADSLLEPGLVILEAPMGEGKTEAAIYLTDHWAVALGQKGCYFALPTMATSHQMFGRVKEFLQDRYPETNVNLQLLHGHASLSAEFQVLQNAGHRMFNPTGIEAAGRSFPDGPGAEVVAAEWFTYKKRGLLAPFGVGTVDQALLAVLKTKHYFVRLFGLAGKTVIIDEVHAYDAYMMTLLERLLEWLSACDCAVVLLSATLPEKKRRSLIEAFSRGLGREALPHWQHCPYPRTTWVSRAQAGAEHFPASQQFSRTIRYEWVNGEISEPTDRKFLLGAKLQEILAHGGCAAIICNTVGRAQEVYRALQPFFPQDEGGDGQPELGLFHARYLYEDREKRERQALCRFGKPSDPKVRRPHRGVLVATQVIEQSLDLDFDLMVTEMAPVDLLLQRAGRLHRHRRPRPPGLEHPQLWIMTPNLEKEVPNFGRSAWIYEHHILLRSWLALHDRREINIPGDVEALIEQVYGGEEPPEALSPELVKDWEESLQVMKEDLSSKAVEARSRYILPPYYRDDILEDHNPELEEDTPEVHKTLQAVTRLGAPGLSLICLSAGGENGFLDPEGRNWIDLRERPSWEVTRSLLQRSVTLTHPGLVPWLIRHAQTPLGWRTNALLCRCRMVQLDENHNWQGGGYKLHVNPEEGVVITTTKRED